MKRPHGNWLLSSLMTLFMSHPCLVAQEAVQPGSSSGANKQSGLTEGLLNLLNAPDKDNAAERAKQVGQSPQLPTGRPPNAELDGEDLRAASSDPLQAIRDNMLSAADLLQNGQTDHLTQQVQDDILQQLDEIIRQLDQNQASEQQQNQSSSQQNQSTPQPQDATSEQERNQSSSSKQAQSQTQESDRLLDTDQPSGGRPGQDGQPGSTDVLLSDPVMLQQSVWGQLPEKVRSQMQSRMVERFLPSYQEQIQAYFQALLKSP